MILEMYISFDTFLNLQWDIKTILPEASTSLYLRLHVNCKTVPTGEIYKLTKRQLHQLNSKARWEKIRKERYGETETDT